MKTIMYGYIEEVDNILVVNKNNQVINLLNDKNWPPLNKSFFNVYSNKNHDPFYGAYEGRLILLGGNYKSIELELEEWLIKFENILKKLYWNKVELYIKPEYSEPILFTWDIIIDIREVISKINNSSEIKESDWKFVGPFRKFG